MNLSKDLQEKLNQLVPKEDQLSFVQKAIEEKLKSLKKPKKVSAGSNLDFIELFTDGGSRGNPGHSGGGFVAYLNGKRILEGSEYFGTKTNNQAEYLALRLGLREVYAQHPHAKIKCYLDSQLVVRQINGEYKVKSEKVKPLFEETRRIADQFKNFSIEHIDRNQNKEADQLANKAMDLKY